ncbi:hypothetical protein Y032_0907g2976 [Ancylostoma ceylanicum]|uniref:Uncharacterized protein n=1 Tax=Ancylostoma ceylanicum TaxID=53326 RepID=A0A016WBF1_9BILA|nr:hypothetical protein Y032_0907g2976 [Ancylostoma ceylanicum]
MRSMEDNWKWTATERVRLEAVSRQNHRARVLIELRKRVDSIGICQSSSEKCPLRPFDDFVKADQILSEMVRTCPTVQSGPSHFSCAKDGALPNMGQLNEHVFLNLTRIGIDTGIEF